MLSKTDYFKLKLILFLIVCLSGYLFQISAVEMYAGETKVLDVKGKPSITFLKSEREFVLKSPDKPLRLIETQLGQKEIPLRSEIQKAKGETLYPVYYKNGIRSKATRYLDTGRILISFGKGSDVNYLKFAGEQGLSFVKETNQLFKTAIFRFNQNEELIDLTNRLNRLPEVRRASPDFISPRRLR